MILSLIKLIQKKIVKTKLSMWFLSHTGHTDKSPIVSKYSKSDTQSLAEKTIGMSCSANLPFKYEGIF